MSLLLFSAHTAISVEMASLQALIHQQAKSFGTFGGGDNSPAFSTNAAMPTPKLGVGTRLDTNA
jgi:hypothetical protein